MYYVFLILLSVSVIFSGFPSIPANLSFDEVEFAKLALSLAQQPYAPYSQLATGHSTLYFYILLASLKLFGISSFALRLPAALFGIACVLVFFRIMQFVFKNNIIAILSALTLLSLRWYFNFARFSFEATFLLFLELMCIWLLFEYERKKNLSYFIGSAIFAGLAFHSYYPGKIFFILPLGYVLFRFGKKYLFHYLIVVLLTMMPLLAYYVRHPDVRISQISVLSDTSLSPLGKIAAVGENSWKLLLMPFIKGDMNGRHNFPGKAALNPLAGLLLLAGLVIIAKKIYIKKPSTLAYPLFFVAYTVLSVIPTLISSPNDNPNMLRTFTLIPSIVFFVSIAIHYALSLKKSWILPALTTLLVISTAYELRTYFQFQSRVFRNSFEVTCPLHEVVDEEHVPIHCRVRSNQF